MNSGDDLLIRAAKFAGRLVASIDLAPQAAQLAAQSERTRRSNGNQSSPLPPWGGPGKPIVPTSPIEQPLVFAYTPGVNLIAQPRVGFSSVSFSQLRNLADLCDEIRLPIELLKREVRALEWDVVAREGVTGDRNAQIDEARERLAKPDGITPFDVWINSLLEEMLVTDAVTIYPQRTRKGELLGLEIVDGTTIRPLLDNRGRVPYPPAPGYIQTIRGLPAGQWTIDELWYLPFNSPVYSPYGKPPVEMVILMVNTALRRAQFKLSYYTEGNVPEALVGTPSDWDVTQIQQWQEHWDALLAGDVQKQRRLKFFPTSGGERGGGNLSVHEFKRPETGTDLDEWLLRKGCWAAGVNPAEFGLVPGRGLGGEGFSQGQESVQYRQGLGPVAQYLKGILDQALAEWGFPDLEHRWTALEPAEDKKTQAEVDAIYVNTRIRSRDAIRQERGWADEEEPEEPEAPEPAEDDGEKDTPESNEEPAAGEQDAGEEEVAAKAAGFRPGDLWDGYP